MDAKRIAKIIDDWKLMLEREKCAELIRSWHSMTVDDEFFRLTSILFDMPHSYRNQVIRVFTEGKMPKFYFDRLAKVSIYRKSWNGSSGKKCLGFYDEKNAIIFINPSEFSPSGNLKRTVAHELAHHLSKLNYEILNVDLLKNFREINRKYPGDFKSPEELFAIVFESIFSGKDWEKDVWEKWMDVRHLDRGTFIKKRKENT